MIDIKEKKRLIETALKEKKVKKENIHKMDESDFETLVEEIVSSTRVTGYLVHNYLFAEYRARKILLNLD